MKDENVENEREMVEWERAGIGRSGWTRKWRRREGEGGVEVVGRMPGLGLRGASPSLMTGMRFVRCLCVEPT